MVAVYETNYQGNRSPVFLPKYLLILCYLEPDEKDVKGFNVFLERYKRGLEIERAAVESLYGD